MNLAALQEELEDLKSQNLLRRLRVLSPDKGPYVQYRGKRTLLFCGNDYLGLSQHPRLIHAVKKAADEFGVGAGASRLISGTTDFHDRVEKKLAAFKGKDSAILFPSGYSANLGILSALAGDGDLIAMDKLCHASLIDGAKLSGATLRVFPHKNYGRLEELIEKNQNHRRILIVTDTVFSMDGDLADLNVLVRIKQKFNAMLVVDDAHGTGVFGHQGRGAAEASHVEPDIDVIMGTTSKALGCLGGFAAVHPTIADYLINHARSFIYSTAMPAILCAAIEAGLEVLETEPEHQKKLWDNVAILHQGLTQLKLASGPATSPIFPVLVGEETQAMQISQVLEDRGILIPAIRTPTVAKGKARLRISVSALHTKAEIEALLRELKPLF